MLEKASAILEEIGQKLHTLLSEDDIEIRFVAHVIAAYIESNVHITEYNGNIRRNAHIEDSGKSLWDLRRAMYDANPGKGGFYTMEMTVKQDGRFHTRFEYEDRSGFSLTPSDEEFEEDLQLYPRDGK